ncbi:MAG: autotransporter-associated beta strand repeat-containing protein [Kiritimatiellia bacterium]
MTKIGTGTLTLAGANTYTGPTIVQQGALFVNGSLSTTPVAVKSGGILGGSGTIAGIVTNETGGVIAPGASVGTLTLTSNLVFQNDAILDIEFDCGTITNDTLQVTGNLTLGSSTILRLYDVGIRTQPAGEFVLISYSGNDPAALGNWTVDYSATDWIFGQQPTVRLDGAGPGGKIILTLYPPPKGSMLMLR